MAKGLRSELAEARQASRELRNRLNEVEWPLQKRIRELEVERDHYAVQAKAADDRFARLERGMAAAQALIRWLLDSGKSG